MPGLSGISAVAAGGYNSHHSLALRSDGAVFAWGSNDSGQLGDETTTNRSTPVRISGSYSAIAAGKAHNVAMKADGTVWAWGDNSFNQLGDGTSISRLAPIQVGSGYVAITAGWYHNLLGVKTDNTLWSWGCNQCNGPGALGDGTTTYSRYKSVQVGGGYRSVAGGETHSLALKTGGTVWPWGNNQFGQLGVGAPSANPG